MRLRDHAKVPWRRRWRVIALVMLTSLLLTCLLSSVAYSWISRRSAIQTSLLWARLQPFPASAKNIDINTGGSMFTREFFVEFTAPKDEIVAWLRASPGTSQAPLQVDVPSQTISITPGGSAQSAQVTIDWVAGRVKIRTYWS